MEIKIDKFIIWDREEETFKFCRAYNFDEEHKRHYFKYVGCGIWLEDEVALDVFVVGKKGELIRFRDFIA